MDSQVEQMGVRRNVGNTRSSEQNLLLQQSPPAPAQAAQPLLQASQPDQPSLVVDSAKTSQTETESEHAKDSETEQKGSTADPEKSDVRLNEAESTDSTNQSGVNVLGVKAGGGISAKKRRSLFNKNVHQTLKWYSMDSAKADFLFEGEETEDLVLNEKSTYSVEEEHMKVEEEEEEADASPNGGASNREHTDKVGVIRSNSDSRRIREGARRQKFRNFSLRNKKMPWEEVSTIHITHYVM